MAGREYEPLIANGIDDVGLGRRDDAVGLHRVDEVRVGHLDLDLVARLQRIDMAEGREVGGPVTGDADCRALSRESRVGVMAGPLLEARGVGPLDEDGVEVESLDLDAPDRLARVRLASRELLGERRDLLLGVANVADMAQVGGRRKALLEVGELAARLAVFDRPENEQNRLGQGKVMPTSAKTTSPAVIRVVERMRRARCIRTNFL